MPPPPISPHLLRWFRVIVRRYFRRQFHGVRLSGLEHARGIEGPLIVYANHSSWWDPMVAFLLAEQLSPDRAHYAPMDADALSRYRILQRLGIFPVETNSPRGAVQFLRTGQEILAANGVLWITPEGRFADPRARPLHFKPGLSALATRAASRLGSCTIIPLAIEYTFWDERLPECLLRLGTPIAVPPNTEPEAFEAELRAALATEMDALAALIVARYPAAFHTLIDGSAGVGGFYALGKRLRAAILRRPYNPEHTPHPAQSTADLGAPEDRVPHPRKAGVGSHHPTPPRTPDRDARVPHSCAALSRMGGIAQPPQPDTLTQPTPHPSETR